MDPPHERRVADALRRLHDLGALDHNLAVTPIGFKMADFPLSPNLAKILLTAAGMGCSDEVLTIVSMLSSNNNYIFVRPKKKQKEADNIKKTMFNDYKVGRGRPFVPISSVGGAGFAALSDWLAGVSLAKLWP